MANVYDIMVDQNGDDIHRDGDFLQGECTMQNQKTIIITEKGSLRPDPMTGVGVNSWLLDEKDGQDLKAEIQNQYEADGATISHFKMTSLEDIDIQASYGNQES